MRFRTDLDAVVLAALQQGELHGYGIVRAIRGRTDGVLKLGEGQLYPILHRLEADGLIEGKWEIQEGKPSRKIYSLTKDGLGALETRSRDWLAFSKAVGNMLGHATGEREKKDTGTPVTLRKEAKNNA